MDDSDNISLDFGNICRLCLSDADGGTSIFDLSEQFKTTSPAFFLNKITSLKIDFMDSFPDMVCKTCITSIVSIHHFITVCLRSDATLRKWCSSAVLTPDACTEIFKDHNLESKNHSTTTTSTDQEALSSLDIPINNINNDVRSDVLLHKRCGSAVLTPDACTEIVKDDNLGSKNHVTTSTNQEALSSLDIPINYINNGVRSDAPLRKRCGSAVLTPDACTEIVKDNLGSKNHGTTSTYQEALSSVDVPINNIDNPPAALVAKMRKLKKKRNVNYVSCAFCGKIYSRKQTLQSHIFGYHLNVKKNIPYIVCSLCGKTIKGDVNRLSMHLKNVHFERIVKGFGQEVQKTNLSTRLRSRDIHQSFLCKICGKVLKTAINLKLHEQRHIGEKLFKCEICEKELGTSSYKKHMRIHQKTDSSIRVHKCDMCPKSYRGSETLKRHKFTHTGTRPFSCPECQKCFFTITEMKTHLSHHKGTPRYQCPYCHKSFWQRTPLRLHIMAHKNIRPHSCEHCEKTYIDKKNLVRHLLDKHQIRMEKDEQRYLYPRPRVSIEDLLEL